MTSLADVSAEALRERLAGATSAKAAKRLVVALSYKDGESVEAMSERYGIPRSTLYYWLDRFEERPLADAVEDDARPGRPPRLGVDERERLAADLADRPADHGYEAAEWTPALLRRHLEAEYGVSYSLGHVRRLLRESVE